MELEQQLLGIGRTFGIEPVVTPALHMFDERLGRLGMAQEILLDITTDYLIVGLREKGTVHIVNVLTDGLHAHPFLTYFRKNFQYLLVVTQNLKKRPVCLFQLTGPFMLSVND